MIASIQYCERTASLRVGVERERAVVREHQRGDVAEHDERRPAGTRRRSGSAGRSRSPSWRCRTGPSPGRTGRRRGRRSPGPRRAGTSGSARRRRRARSARALCTKPAAAARRRSRRRPSARPRSRARRSRRRSPTPISSPTCRDELRRRLERRSRAPRSRRRAGRARSFHSWPWLRPSNVTVPIITATSATVPGTGSSRGRPPSSGRTPTHAVARLEHRQPREQVEVDRERLAVAAHGSTP